MSRSFVSQKENDVLNWLFGTTAYTPHPSNLVLRLSTTLATDAGVITEPSGGGYVEQAITFGAAASGVVSSTNTITFPTATAPWGKIIAWEVYDTVAAVAVGSGYMGTFTGGVYVLYDTSSVTPSLIRVDVGAPPASGVRCFFVRTDPDGSAMGDPSNFGISSIEDGVEYWSRDSAGDGFKLALTQGGAVVSLSASSDGTYAFHSGNFEIWISKTATVNAGDTLVFPPGSISISLK
jgi:hypothetical protein